jgi:hypothetical protein
LEQVVLNFAIFNVFDNSGDFPILGYEYWFLLGCLQVFGKIVPYFTHRYNLHDFNSLSLVNPAQITLERLRPRVRVEVLVPIQQVGTGFPPAVVGGRGLRVPPGVFRVYQF